MYMCQELRSGGDTLTLSVRRAEAGLGRRVYNYMCIYVYIYIYIYIYIYAHIDIAIYIYI